MAFCFEKVLKTKNNGLKKKFKATRKKAVFVLEHSKAIMCLHILLFFCQAYSHIIIFKYLHTFVHQVIKNVTKNLSLYDDCGFTHALTYGDDIKSVIIYFC